MKKRIVRLFFFLVAAQFLLPAWLLAAEGGATDLVVVADTRVIHNPVLLYLSNIYNTDPLMSGVWAVVLTAGYGCFLGFLMDFVMSRTGLDLKSRKIVEH